MGDRKRDQTPAADEQPMELQLEETMGQAEDELETLEQQDLEDKEPDHPRRQRG